MSVLIFLDQAEGHIKKSSFEAACYGAKVAELLGTTAEAIVLGTVNDDMASLGKYGIKKIYGAVLNGKNLYREELRNGLLVIGNEANGISPEIEEVVQQKITIPKTSKHQKTESLNVATATAIVLSEFCRIN